ncbi:hypothetical protein [Paenarthrobacter aurescens]|jgi:hypothetical protein|uniref:Acetone carboxylase n=1 Tax=Paenarthrobacter aurescens (strain TC1) TaxID=290340 RepID=A1R6K0_PAEAT|nr:hypothetical protein [Paenarthrobacter aurescens]ABM08918.1 conserved hypothetical protein [Paenarthrobacter aurescens TC1]
MNIFNLGGLGAAGQESERATVPALCSRKGCRAGAEWQLLWNNPRIHTPDRRKVWLSCGDHRDWLEDYLQTRGLWKETVPFTASEATSNEAG